MNVLIIGCGKVGSRLADILCQFGQDVYKRQLLIQYTPGRSLLTRTARSILYVGETVSKSPSILPLEGARLTI